MNFGGGYHHAFRDHGEGFCFFSDAALSILHAKEKQLLESGDKVLVICVIHKHSNLHQFKAPTLQLSA